MAKKIYITSYKGGTGVTSFAVGLGKALAQSGERTLVVDGDTLCGSALLNADCRDLTVYTLADYEKGACRAKQTLVTHPKCSNLLFMPCIGMKNAESACTAVREVEGLFDYVLADKTAKEVCDCAYIVTEPAENALKSADMCRSGLADGGFKEIYLAVTKLCAGSILHGESLTANEISALLHTELGAIIPEDLCLAYGKTSSSAERAYKLSAEKLTGKGKNLYNVLGGMRGMSGYFKKKLREKL